MNDVTSYVIWVCILPTCCDDDHLFFAKNLCCTQVRYGKGPVLKIEQNFETLQNDSRLLIDTKFGMVTHTVNSNLKPLLFFEKVT